MRKKGFYYIPSCNAFLIVRPLSDRVHFRHHLSDRARPWAIHSSLNDNYLEENL
jgi:hypothetical protein